MRNITIVFMLASILSTPSIANVWPDSGTETESTVMSSAFGPRVLSSYDFHRGVDFAISYGSNVYAISEGTVQHSESLGEFGLSIVIEHSSTFYTVYAHLSSIQVDSGDVVNEGDLIAESGQSDNGAIHLHFAVLTDFNLSDYPFPEENAQHPLWRLPHSDQPDEYDV